MVSYRTELLWTLVMQREEAPIQDLPHMQDRFESTRPITSTAASLNGTSGPSDPCSRHCSQICQETA